MQDHLAARAEEDAAAGEPPDTDAAAAFEAARAWVERRVGSSFRLSHAAPLPPDLLTTVMVRHFPCECSVNVLRQSPTLDIPQARAACVQPPPSAMCACVFRLFQDQPPAQAVKA